MKTEYSPKEIAAFEGLLRLAREGRSFSSLKVQDIATAAGIGKGTLYEYFSSKEEIVASAMLYALDDALTKAEATLARTMSFRQVLAVVFREVVHESGEAALMVLTGMMTKEQRSTIWQNNVAEAGALLARLRAGEQQLFALGRQTGEIDPALDDRFCEYVIVASLVGEIGAISMKCPRETDSSRDPYPIQMICRALRGGAAG